MSEELNPETITLPLCEEDSTDIDVSANYSSIFKKQIRLGIPMIGINLADTLEGFITGMILGKITNDALSAGSIIGSTNLILSASIMAPMHAASILIREAKGAGKHTDITILWRQSILLGSLLSLGRMVLMKWALSPALSLVIEREEIISIVQDYYNIFLIATIPNSWSHSYENFLLGIDKTSIVIAVKFFKLVIFILSAYALALDTLGMDLGVQGLGYAFCLQTLTGLLLYGFIAAYKDELKDYKLLNHLFVRSTKHLKRVWSVGWPLGLSTLNEMSSEFLMAVFTSNFKDPAMAARAIAGNYNSLLYQPTLALSRGSSLLVSESIGEKRFQDIHRIGNAGIMMGLTTSMIGLLLLCSIPKSVSSLFIDVNDKKNDDLVQLMRPVLALTAAAELIDSVIILSNGALSGLPDTFMPAIITTACTWAIGVPLAYVIGNYTGLNLNGLLLGQAAGMLTGSLAMYLRWYRESNNKEKYSPVATIDIDECKQPLLQNASDVYRNITPHSSMLFTPRRASELESSSQEVEAARFTI
jgi:MATE family multidrug resistance protein